MSDLPRGWAIASLQDFASINMGQSPKSSTYNETGDGLPFYQGKAEFGKIYPKPKKYCSEPTKVAEAGEILLSVRAPVGPTNICRERSCIGRGLAAIQAFEKESQKYLFYFLRFIEPWMSEQGTGSTFKAVSGGFLRNEINITIAPIGEQIRIVEKLDRLLAKVDAARIHLDKIPALIERFRQSVLAAATSGYLAQDQEGAERTWDQLTVEDLLKDSKSLSYGVLKPGKYDATGTYMLRVKDLGPWGKFESSEVFKISNDLADEYKRTTLREGDIVLSVMATIGRPAIVPKQYDGANVNRALAVLKFNDRVIAQYFLYLLLAPEFQKEFVEKSIGSAQKRINLTELRKFPVRLPRPPEQKEIVRRIEDIFTIADRIESQYQAARAQVDKLTQSLLAKAFRGELVPQDPKDEPANKLLERIRAQREKASLSAPTLARVPRKSSKRKVTKMKLKDAPEDYLANILRKHDNRMEAETLWRASELGVDDFYEKLKQEDAAGFLREEPGNKEVEPRYLITG